MLRAFRDLVEYRDDGQCVAVVVEEAPGPQAAGDGRLPPEDAFAQAVRCLQDDAIDLLQELPLAFGRLGEGGFLILILRRPPAVGRLYEDDVLVVLARP